VNFIALLPHSFEMKLLPFVALASLLGWSVFADNAHAIKTPSYQTLLPLREQAELQNAWVAERKAAIPALLQKYHVDAWLVSLTYPPLSFLFIFYC
jgi:hypothetical protein